MKKPGILLAIGWLLSLVGGIWSIISFLLYLFKDEPFQWIALIITIIGYILLFVFVLKMSAEE